MRTWRRGRRTWSSPEPIGPPGALPFSRVKGNDGRLVSTALFLLVGLSLVGLSLVVTPAVEPGAVGPSPAVAVGYRRKA